jgi:hypothetical protein
MSREATILQVEDEKMEAELSLNVGAPPDWEGVVP